MDHFHDDFIVRKRQEQVNIKEQFRLLNIIVDVLPEQIDIVNIDERVVLDFVFDVLCQYLIQIDIILLWEGNNIIVDLILNQLGVARSIQ